MRYSISPHQIKQKVYTILNSLRLRRSLKITKSSIVEHEELQSNLKFVSWTFVQSLWKSLSINVVCCSVAKSCPTLCDPMNCSTPGFPILHHLPEFAQTRVHWVSDHIQPSHPLSPSSPPAFNLSQHQGLFQCQLFPSGGLSIGASPSASVLPMNIQGWFPLGSTGLISLLSKELSRVFSSTTVWKHQFFSTQPSLWSSSHICTWLLEKL